VTFHRRYLELVAEIEQRFPVAEWSCGDVSVWPLARMDLYNDLYRISAGGYAPSRQRPLPLRAVAKIATPIADLWRNRRGRLRRLAHPIAAHAIVLGDGVSLDCIGGEWQDRFAEPVMCALQKRGLSTFVMQPGGLRRAPWHRPTFAAWRMAQQGSVASSSRTVPVRLPGLAGVRTFLVERGVAAASFEPGTLTRRAQDVYAAATGFVRVLDVVEPVLAFVVTYYAGLGAAFLVACRRRGVLSVDLQHCPQDGSHKAYGWNGVPTTGYSTLPAVFWTWTQSDTEHIRRWTCGLPRPWHESVHGGHTQIARFLDDQNAQTREWDAVFERIGDEWQAGTPGREGRGTKKKPTREILIALQPIGGHRDRWQALATQIASSPSGWRWWVRRHPAAGAHQDVEYAAILGLGSRVSDGPRVNITDASAVPLPALLRHMNALVSLASGAAAEAAVFGVPALFLSDEACGPFGNLIASGAARVVDVGTVNDVVRGLPEVRRPARPIPPAIDQTLLRLESLAVEYRLLCAADRAGRG
jgi:hypothetical protein